MNNFSAINLKALPEPSVIKTLDFENILNDLRTDLISRDPSLADVLTLESEPLNKLLEAFAYRELILRAEFNDQAKATMLAFAVSADLDHIAALFNVERLDNEDDERLRSRTQLAFEGLSTAGSRGSYIFHALSADNDVLDVSVDSPEFEVVDDDEYDPMRYDPMWGVPSYASDDKITWKITKKANLEKPRPGDVVITVLSEEKQEFNYNQGVASEPLLEKVKAKLNDEHIRPLTDRVNVQSAEIVHYRVDAMIYFYEEIGAEQIMTKAKQNLEKWTKEHHKLGHNIHTSAIHQALHIDGVQRVELFSDCNIQIAPNQAGFCTSISIEKGGIDE